VSYLLDTHALVWWLTGDQQLSREARSVIGGQGPNCFVSVASAYELGIKVQNGKMEFARNIWNNLPTIVESNGFQILPISFEHSLLAPKLPTNHRDPFDRMLAAQSIVEAIPIMTIDQRIADLGAKVIW
jgi:PIN domain nuclease of toxin-antitoxin system